MGQIVGVIGPVREGRRALSFVASGLEAPESGQVKLAEIDITGLSRSKRVRFARDHVLWSGRMPDERSEAHGHVAMSLLARGLATRDAKRLAWEGLARVGALDCAMYSLAELSGWERLLVEFARVVATRPRFVVIDGLFDDLGSGPVLEAGQRLRWLVNALGCGVLLGAASPESASVVDRAWRMDRGRLAPMSKELLAQTNVFSLIPRGEGCQTGFESRIVGPPLQPRQMPSSSRSAETSQATVILDEVPDVVNQLLTTEVALGKLGARGISVVEAEQTIWNNHVVVRNRRGSPERRQPDMRRLIIGRSDANRALTLVIEQTVEPTTWLPVTGWDSTPSERKILERS